MVPVASAEAEVRCTNLRTGETDMYSVRRTIGPHRVKEIAMEVIPDHAGRYELSVSSVRVFDPLGIWSKEIQSENVRGMTVLPAVFDMQMVTAGTAANPESDRHTGRARGSVMGDMIGIREYVPGDPVRNIHWKLSEKTDKMLVKELGNPLADRLLVILDSSADIAQDPVALDAVASVFTSLIHTLRMNDMEFSASWTDPVTGAPVIRRIINEDDLRTAADEYLAVPATMPGAFHKIEKHIADSRFSHVLVVGSTIPENIENITNGCKATILMYGGNRSFSDKNLTVISFEANSYAIDTAGIEV
jgi:hypothetical protein